jgi:hypothetical protein
MSMILATLAMALQSGPVNTRLGQPDNRGCEVLDTSGTPTNVRATPNGRVVRQIGEDQYVVVVRTARDSRGREWRLVKFSETGRPIGWVLADLLACY